MRYLELKVASISENTNSFGLYGFILMARNGITWQVGGNYLKRKELDKGDIIKAPMSIDGKPNFAPLGFEIPESLEKAPPAVVQEVWG